VLYLISYFKYFCIAESYNFAEDFNKNQFKYYSIIRTIPNKKIVIF